MFVDFECPECGRVWIDVWVPTRVPFIICECGKRMQKRVASPGFVVKGYNAKNGYSDD